LRRDSWDCLQLTFSAASTCFKLSIKNNQHKTKSAVFLRIVSSFGVFAVHELNNDFQLALFSHVIGVGRVGDASVDQRCHGVVQHHLKSTSNKQKPTNKTAKKGKTHRVSAGQLVGQQLQTSVLSNRVAICFRFRHVHQQPFNTRKRQNRQKGREKNLTPLFSP
jgi:hypothetical protein